MEREGVFGETEALVEAGVRWLQLAVEALSALAILAGVLFAGAYFIRAIRRGTHEGYEDVRLTLARYLVVALEFQLAADILATAVSPTWDQIGKLAAIAAIRTLLNYFLNLEMERERRELGQAPAPGAERIGLANEPRRPPPAG